MNTQPISKPDNHPSGNLQVHSVFYTIQGEGPFCGQPAIFVRLWGCNLQCPGCDTEYTNKKVEHTPEQLLAEVQKLRKKANTLVVITGGEPLRQNLTPFVALLSRNCYRVQIETNGTLPLSPGLSRFISHDVTEPHACFIVCSPKAGKVNRFLEQFILAYKYVSDDQMMVDGLPMRALGHGAIPYLARPHAEFSGEVYLQPVDSKNSNENVRNQNACVASVLEHGYTLQLQVHKLIGVE